MHPISNTTLSLPPLPPQANFSGSSNRANDETTQTVAGFGQEMLVLQSAAAINPATPQNGEVLHSMARQIAACADDWESYDIDADLAQTVLASSNREKTKEVEEDLADTAPMISFSPQKKLRLCEQRLEALNKSILKIEKAISEKERLLSNLWVDLRCSMQDLAGKTQRLKKNINQPTAKPELATEPSSTESQEEPQKKSVNFEKIRVRTEREIAMEAMPPQESKASDTQEKATTHDTCEASRAETKSLVHRIAREKEALNALKQKLKEQRNETYDLEDKIGRSGAY